MHAHAFASGQSPLTCCLSQADAGAADHDSARWHSFGVGSALCSALVRASRIRYESTLGRDACSNILY